MSDLRDLDDDRRFLNSFTVDQKKLNGLWKIADAALDEIERLKWLLVYPISSSSTGWWFGRVEPGHVQSFPTEADAWAAVRKAAMNGKT